MLWWQMVDQLFACPFCRQMFTKGEVETCPECDIKVQPLAELPPSAEAQALDPEQQTPPEDEVLPWSYTGRGRGILVIIALAGIAVFFAPWLHETTPEIRTLSGFEFARELPWLWATGVAWFVMAAVVGSRRTIRQMRGTRVAVTFLAAMVLLTVLTRYFLKTTSHPYIVLRFSYGWGMYTSGFLALIAVGLGFRFGGALEDMPTKQDRPEGEVLH